MWAWGGTVGPGADALGDAPTPGLPQTEYARLENGRFVYRIHRSPMCEYMINFIHKLKHLPEKYMMNSVLENFTILQVWGGAGDCRGGGEHRGLKVGVARPIAQARRLLSRREKGLLGPYALGPYAC